jgi:hypothetical protein
VVSGRSWFGFLAGFALLCCVLLGTSAVDATGRWGPAILAAVLVTAVVVERVGCPSPLPDVLRRLGLGRPAGRALAVAAAVSGLVVLVFPVTAALTGTVIPLRPDWPWLLCRSWSTSARPSEPARWPSPR